MAADPLLQLIDRAFDDNAEIPERVRHVARIDALQVLRRQRQAGHTVRLNRQLPAAAAIGHRLIEGTYHDQTGAITTHLAENHDGRLIVTIRSTSEPTGPVMFVWTEVTNAGVGPTRRLITPLAPTDGRWEAQYDLGSMRHTAAVDLSPALPVDIESVTVDDVAGAFDVVQYGSARRSWITFSEHPRVPLAVRAAVRRHLS